MTNRRFILILIDNWWAYMNSRIIWQRRRTSEKSCFFPVCPTMPRPQIGCQKGMKGRVDSWFSWAIHWYTFQVDPNWSTWDSHIILKRFSFRCSVTLTPDIFLIFEGGMLTRRLSSLYSNLAMFKYVQFHAFEPIETRMTQRTLLD